MNYFFFIVILKTQFACRQELQIEQKIAFLLNMFEPPIPMEVNFNDKQNLSNVFKCIYVCSRNTLGSHERDRKQIVVVGSVWVCCLCRSDQHNHNNWYMTNSGWG